MIIKYLKIDMYENINLFDEYGLKIDYLFY